MSALPYLDGEALRELVPMALAVQVLEDALRGGLDPEDTPRRPVVEVPVGQLLLMPAAWGRHAGIKVAGVARATVVVEARGVALAEAGDLIIPLRNGTITIDHLAGNLRDLVADAVPRRSGPRVFKGVGMAWEDLVVAAAAHETWTRAI